jgi:hypothetical protein
VIAVESVEKKVSALTRNHAEVAIQIIRDVSIDVAPLNGLVIPAIGRFGVGGEGVRGLLGRYVDGAAGRIAPEQCALRAFEDFDPFDIVEIKNVGRLERLVNAVDIGCDGRSVELEPTPRMNGV